MKTGAHYGVESYRGDCDAIELKECRIKDDTLIIAMASQVNRIDVYGQGGSLVATRPRDSIMLCPMLPGHTYLRAEIHMDECVYYLNPIVRTTSGTPLLASAVEPAINGFATWTCRLLLVLVILWLAYRIYHIAADRRTT
jgi:hypothetical protein